MGNILYIGSAAAPPPTPGKTSMCVGEFNGGDFVALVLLVAVAGAIIYRLFK